MKPVNTTLLLILACLSMRLFAADEPSDANRDDPVSVGPSADSATELSPDLREALDTFEAILRIREGQVHEARRFVELRQDFLDTINEQGGVANPPRLFEQYRVSLAAADAQLIAREAERDELRIRLEQIRRETASPSPEPDRSELRARLLDDVHIREARLTAREGWLKAAELQRQSQSHSLDNYVKMIHKGVAKNIEARERMYRLSKTEAMIEALTARRDSTRTYLLRARRLLNAFDDPETGAQVADRLDPENLEARVAMLEHLVNVLRDEMDQIHWKLLYGINS